MREKPLVITPQSKLGEILERYPYLEEALIALSPEFRRLKNPVLRATVAKVATLSQIARIGGLPVADLVRTLRDAAGEESTTAERGVSETPTASPAVAPPWLQATERAVVIDVRPILDRGEHPMPEVMRAAQALGPSDMLDLIAPFEPAPIIEILRGKGFDTWTERRSSGEVHTFVRRR